jgi:uncharacterized repeat protein (TIGR03803 family)
MPRTNRISAGNLYGATSAGGTGQCAPDNPFSGCGTIFELSSSLSGGSWTEQVLYNFTGGSDGDLPYTGLVFDQAGNLYGTAVEGGRITEPFPSGGCGTVFRLSPPATPGNPWSETTLHEFRAGRDAASYGCLLL